jgi:hypothetical protein
MTAAMTWLEITAAVFEGLLLPAEHADPWKLDRVSPGIEAAALLICAIGRCEAHTGLRPNQVTTSVQPTFVARYLGADDRSAVLESWPGEDDPAEVVLGLSSETANEARTLARDAATDDAPFLRMAEFLRGEP